MFLEVYATHNQTMRYFYQQSAPFNFIFISNVTKETSAEDLKKMVDNYILGLPNGTWPNWVVRPHTT